MLRYISRALAACASIAAFALFSPSASAQFQVHPPVGGAGIGGDPESPDSDRFGTAVAIRSGLAFMSAPFHPPGGAVVVYTATPTALIPTGIELRPSNAEPFETFGFTLTYRDGVLLVGSDRAMYVFQRNSSGVWTQRQRITPFGSSSGVGYEDGTLALGASDAVNIYQRDAGKFTLRQKLVSPDSPPHTGLGRLSMAGPTMVVGGYGRAYLFRRNSTGVWRHRQTLIASELGTEGGARAAFGSGAVAIDRGMIIVGAPELNKPEGEIFAEGAAYGFVLDGTSYVETFKLQPRLDGYGNPSFLFGQQIAMFAERIVVGAYSFVPTGGAFECDFFEGAFFSYTRSGSSVLPRGVASSSGNGHSMALADQRLLVGTPCIDSRFPTPGRATLFRLNVFR